MITGIIFVLFLALIVFGPKKTVEMCGTVGRAVSQFKQAADQFQSRGEIGPVPLIREAPLSVTPSIERT
jgi:Sec-independent protein translocase protein TatA